jgi:hypothetical protein
MPNLEMPDDDAAHEQCARKSGSTSLPCRQEIPMACYSNTVDNHARVHADQTNLERRSCEGLSRSLRSIYM